MSTKNFDDFVDFSRKDIWRYAKLLTKIKEDDWIDAKQVNFTPIERAGMSSFDLSSEASLPKQSQYGEAKVDARLGGGRAKWWIKREDKSVTGSHKFRSLAYQISCLLDSGTRKAILSSSGNAAIAASILLPKNANLKLFVFLSKKTPPEKLAAIKFTKNLIPILSSRPLRLAKYVIKHFNLKDLRPSQDPNAAIGFRSLGFEIFEQMPKVKNIFSFATSEASIRGIAEAYEFLMKSEIIERMPQLFAVNPSGQLAGNLVAKSAVALAAKAEHVTNKNLRSGNKNICRVDNSICRVDISDTEILSTRQKYSRLETSSEGLASLAAAEKIKPKGESLIVLTGRIWPKKKPHLNKFLEAENFVDVDKIIARYDA